MAQCRNDLDKQQDLVGYHLGLIDTDARARVQEAFESRESLAAACDSLQSLLAPLDAETAPAPPKNLTQGVLDRVAELDLDVLPARRVKALPDELALIRILFDDEDLHGPLAIRRPQSLL